MIQSNEMRFPSAIGNQCWFGLKSFTSKEQKFESMLGKTLFILKSSDGLRDFTEFKSVSVHYSEKDRIYVFEIISVPISLRD